MEARFGNLSVVSFYIPSGSSGRSVSIISSRSCVGCVRFCASGCSVRRDYVLCGDWNIVRSALDIRNWKSNQKNSGCLPLERDWLNGLCADSLHDVNSAQGRGWVDTYRVLHPQGEDYTWWSNRGAARVNNVGWRIDYQFVSPGLRERVSRCAIYL